jgi:hypothetical protein
MRFRIVIRGVALGLRDPINSANRQQTQFGQNAETPLKETSSSGATSSDSWAWVELNYRPHAYQAGSYEHEFRLRSSYSPAFDEHPAQHVAHLRTSCALPRTFCAFEWTPQRTPFTGHHSPESASGGHSCSESRRRRGFLLNERAVLSAQNDPVLYLAERGRRINCGS